MWMRRMTGAAPLSPLPARPGFREHPSVSSRDGIHLHSFGTNRFRSHPSQTGSTRLVRETCPRPTRLVRGMHPRLVQTYERFLRLRFLFALKLEKRLSRRVASFRGIPAEKQGRFTVFWQSQIVRSICDRCTTSELPRPSFDVRDEYETFGAHRRD